MFIKTAVLAVTCGAVAFGCGAEPSRDDNQEIIDNLSAAREAIFSDIRGEDKGTTSFTMLYVSPANLTKYDNLIGQAARTSSGRATHCSR